MGKYFLSLLLTSWLVVCCRTKHSILPSNESLSKMAGDWEMAPPLSDNQFPSVSPGARIEKSFKIIKQKSENEILTCLHWTGLSRQQISILRNLTSSTQLQQLLRPYGYGISSGISIDLSSKKDPLDAEYDLMVSSKKEIKPETMNKIVNFVKRYRVR